MARPTSPPRSVVGDGTVRADASRVRDPCAKHLGANVFAWHGLAVNVLVEGAHNQISSLETRPIYVLIVEVAGSSPVTSTVTSTRCLFHNVLPGQGAFLDAVRLDRSGRTAEPEP